MSIASLTFIGVFFPLLLFAYFNPLFKRNSFRKFLLFCFNLGLYTLCEPIYILLLIGVIVIDFLLVKIDEKYHLRFARILAIIIDVAILLCFKYINLLLSTCTLFGHTSSFLFPIGLSYFIFKAISYVVDSKDNSEGNFVDVAIYISNFLTIVSGPLSTYSEELPSIRNKRQYSLNNTYTSLERFVIGFSKKVIIADSLGVLVNQCFSTSEISLFMAWAGAIGYTLQLYFDFSGYTDMAIGLGSLFGFLLPENFNNPYMSKSISEFWKCWHISLTKWFTKYIYIPLGGSRVNSVVRHVFNLFVVWLVTGMWHGSSLNYLLWAMIYFVFQLIEKYTAFADRINKIHLGHFYTLLIVVIEWVIFRSESIVFASTYIKSMFLLNSNMVVLYDDLSIISKYAIPLCLGIIFSTNIGDKIKTSYSDNRLFGFVYNAGLVVLFVISVLVSMSQGYAAPLYAGF